MFSLLICLFPCTVQVLVRSLDLSSLRAKGRLSDRAVELGAVWSLPEPWLTVTCEGTRRKGCREQHSTLPQCCLKTQGMSSPVCRDMLGRAWLWDVLWWDRKREKFFCISGGTGEVSPVAVGASRWWTCQKSSEPAHTLTYTHTERMSQTVLQLLACTKCVTNTQTWTHGIMGMTHTFTEKCKTKIQARGEGCGLWSEALNISLRNVYLRWLTNIHAYWRHCVLCASLCVSFWSQKIFPLITFWFYFL